MVWSGSQSGGCRTERAELCSDRIGIFLIRLHLYFKTQALSQVAVTFAPLTMQDPVARMLSAASRGPTLSLLRGGHSRTALGRCPCRKRRLRIRSDDTAGTSTGNSVHAFGPGGGRWSRRSCPARTPRRPVSADISKDTPNSNLRAGHWRPLALIDFL